MIGQRYTPTFIVPNCPEGSSRRRSGRRKIMGHYVEFSKELFAVSSVFAATSVLDTYIETAIVVLK